ncbi:ATG26 [Symbiodinium natans]|uniref:ATG26 protein n=1 Tax=Symbiodinium natans TaxID=878477 RepID=A0A812REN6_9DINO|nr:ATG26 [Symbiodinium natans]
MVVTDLSASRIRFDVFDTADALASAVPWASADIAPADLARKAQWSLLLSHTDSTEAVYGATPNGAAPADVRLPAFLHLVVTRDGETPKESPSASSAAADSRAEGRKKVMLITRGTRGDVQPFVALARGLALHCNCEAMVVTELRWKDFVKKNGLGADEGGDLPRRIRFRPSGGDTTLKVQSRGARFAMTFGQHSDTLQALMLSRSEVEFFSSEGCCYYWAKKERPDFIVFGFTLTHIAMIISESLEIPIVGFTLQPTREIERREWNVRMLGDALEPLAAAVNGVEFQAFLQQAMERIPSPNTLNSLRISRGLLPCPADIDTEDRQTAELLRQNICKVVPISSELLPDQAVDGMKLTDFIFLHENPTQGAKELLREVEQFIEKNKKAGKAVVAMTFSSMPVGKRKMLQIAAELVRQEVACIVLAAGQPEAAKACCGMFYQNTFRMQQYSNRIVRMRT